MATNVGKEFNAEPSAPAAVKELPADITILPAAQVDERQKLVSAKSPIYTGHDGEHSHSVAEDSDDKICRCCHDETDASDLIAPCACTGTAFFFKKKTK